MAVDFIWCGGEDTSFPNGNTPGVSTTAGKAPYARCAVYVANTSQMLKSTLFPGGEITSAYLSFYRICNYNLGNHPLGFGKSGTNKGIYFGVDPDVALRAAIYTYDGATFTKLASESATSIGDNVLDKIDMQLIDYGASSTIKVWMNGGLAINWTGDSRITDVTGFDSIFGFGPPAGTDWISGIIVSANDCRSWSIITHYITAAGDTNDWTGAYTDVDEAATDDADVIYVNTTNKDFQCALSDGPGGTIITHGIKIEVRALKTADSVPGNLKIGLKIGDTVDVDAGRVPTAAWATYERYTDTINGGQLTPGVMNAAQLDLRSGA